MTSAVVAAPQRRCEVCGSPRTRVLRHSAAWGFDVARCRDCDMVFVLDPPSAQVLEEAYSAGGDVDAYANAQRGDEDFRIGVLARIRGLLGVAAGTASEPLLFDVGAGTGDFLLLARAHGFQVAGNELGPRAIAFTRDRHGIELSPLLLGDQPPASVDVVTMWCVLAHVNDPAAFLREALAMLRPGGVLFLRTPRWCLIDTLGTFAARASRGALSRIADRRVTAAHMHLYTARNLAQLLRTTGFADVDVQPACHFPFRTGVYLDSTGISGRLLRPAERLFDALITREWFVRNTLL
ncbi:MAG TPA: class I SAM-dependent methyltransferase, partial [Mycobacteriales bacterium]|nr:class I SAM-dependent methyltransferase [Mycobacteriales bacterium]